MLTTSEKTDDSNSMLKNFLLKGTLVMIVLVIFAFASQTSGQDGNDRKALLQRGSAYEDIYGGYVPSYHHHPFRWYYVVPVLNAKNNHYICAGMILSKQWILTAGHCCWNLDENRAKKADELRVTVGRHPLEDMDMDTVAVIDIKKVVVHEKFDSTKWINDLCKMELDEDLIEANKSVHGNLPWEKVNIATKEWAHAYENKTGYMLAAGWGKTKADQDLPTTHLNVARLEQGDCDKYAWNSTEKEQQDPGQICYGGPGQLNDTDSSVCKRDSGGPLTYPKMINGKNIVLGMTSWHKPPCEPRLGIFVDLPQFRSWIYKDLDKKKK